MRSHSIKLEPQPRLRTVARRVLLVDDDRELWHAVVAGLGPRGYEFSCQPSAEEALAVLELDDGPDWDVVVADISMSGMSGLTLCERIGARFPSLPVVLLTGFASLETAVAAVRAGASDFVTKPFEMNVLALALDRVVQRRRAHEEAKRLRDVAARPAADDGIIGSSPAMRGVIALVDRAAATDAPVLISGAIGTGKELVARALHLRRGGSTGPFVAVSCAALAEDLLERLVEAAGGTLFLDEIGDLPPAIQTRLLHVLEDRAAPVGTRLVTATRRDLEAEVREHRFREDLFYRVRVIAISLPPLHARGNDVLLLARHFARRAADRLQQPVRGLSVAVADKLLGYPWPGNVRELESCIERAVAVARTDELTIEDLPAIVRDASGGQLLAAGADAAALLTMEEVERRHILRVLAAVGTKTEAAAVLGLHSSTLYRKLEHYGRRT